MNIADLAVKISADIAQAEKAMDSMASRLKAIGKDISAVGTTMTKWVTGPIVGAATGLFALAKNTANAGDEIQKMALRTGFSTETLSELRHAAELSGTSIATLETGVKRMSRVILDAERDMDAANRSIGALGLTIDDLQGLAPEEQFLKLAAALAEVESDSHRAALAQEIFGRAGTELLPMLAKGAEGLEEMRKEAHTLGLVFGQEAADASAAFNDDLTRLKGALTGVLNETGQKLIPVLADILVPVIRDSLIPFIGTLTERISSAVDWFRALSPQAQKVIAIAIGLAAALGPVLLIVGKLIVAVTSLMNPFGLVVVAIMAVIAAGTLLCQNWDTIKDKALSIWGAITGGVKNAANSIIGFVNGIINAFENMVNAMARAINSIPRFEIPSWVPLIGGQSFGLPKIDPISLPRIPSFAEGGIVPGPLGAPQLIMAHGGERVLTREQQAGVTVIYQQNAPVYGMLDFEQQVKETLRDAIQGGAFRGLIPSGV